MSSIMDEARLSPKFVPARVPHPGKPTDPRAPPKEAKARAKPLEMKSSVDFLIKEIASDPLWMRLLSLVDPCSFSCCCRPRT